MDLSTLKEAVGINRENTRHLQEMQSQDDVSWVVSVVHGIPALVLESRNPYFISLAKEMKLQDVRVIEMTNLTSDGVTFVVFDKGWETHILTGDWDSSVRAVVEADRNGSPWLLLFQGIEEGRELAVPWGQRGGQALRLPDIDSWPVQMVRTR